jgi:hypothetical protein
VVAGVLVIGVVEVEAGAVEPVVDDIGGLDVVFSVVLPVVVVGDVVGPTVVVVGDLQADAREIEASAVPAVKIPALFKTCRLEYLVTRNILFISSSCFIAFSGYSLSL